MVYHMDPSTLPPYPHWGFQSLRSWAINPNLTPARFPNSHLNCSCGDIYIVCGYYCVSFLQEVGWGYCISERAREACEGHSNYLSPVSKIPPVTISNHQNRTPHTTWGDNMLVRETKGGGGEREQVRRIKEWEHREEEDGARKRGRQWSRKICRTVLKQQWMLIWNLCTMKRKSEINKAIIV